MSELIQQNARNANIRWQLLASVSALALIANVAVPGTAKAEDADHPTVWIELGAQIEHLRAEQSPFAPPFIHNYAGSDVFVPSLLDTQRVPKNAFGGEGKIVFAPDDSGWLFSLSGRFGRASNSSHSHREKTPLIHNPKYDVHQTGALPSTPATFHEVGDSSAQNRESHLILDFQVGRDIGIGLFGQHDSALSLGVRFAQFTSRSSAELHARPQISFYSKYLPPFVAPPSGANVPLAYFHEFNANVLTNRSFHGIGPSVSWQGSLPFFGNRDDGQFQFDLGVNGAVLFGRQKVAVSHTTTGYYYAQGLVLHAGTPRHVTYQAANVKFSRSRSVSVPNLGGFAGVSMKFTNAKVSLGYRADYFFGAIDAGSSSHRSGDVGFHGPFATISIGLGG